MSKHNYSQYSNKKKTNNPNNKKIIEKSIEEVKPVEVETAEITPENPKVKVEIPETVEGVVVNCAKLNVRAEPSTTAEVICVLDAMSEIEIDINQSIDGWFKICTATGVEGYCMRKFIDAYL